MEKITTEEAKKIVEKELQENRKKCWEEIQKVLEKHGMEMRIVNQVVFTEKK